MVQPSASEAASVTTLGPEDSTSPHRRSRGRKISPYEFAGQRWLQPNGSQPSLCTGICGTPIFSVDAEDQEEKHKAKLKPAIVALQKTADMPEPR
jgi:hypothetical protein